MLAEKQWVFNAALLFFMVIAVLIALVVVSFEICKALIIEAAAPLRRERVPDSPPIAGSGRGTHGYQPGLHGDIPR